MGSAFLPGLTALSPVTGLESVATFASDCVTPKTDFNLGETVCVKVTGAFFSAPRRINWVHPSGLVASSTSITSDPQTDLFTIPATSANLGTWKVTDLDLSDATIRASALLTVHNPAQPAADLTVYKAFSDSSNFSDPAAPLNITSRLFVWNQGPDDAQNVVVIDAVPNNTTLGSIVQESGPTFTWTSSSSATTFNAPSLAKGATAIFTIVYQLTSTTSDASSSASISSATADPSNVDNASADTAPVTGSSGGGGGGGGGGTCTLTCPGNITQNNDPNQAGAVVNYSAPTTSGSCGTVTSDPPSGSFFPIGTTTVTAHDDAGNSCSFTVTINDTRPLTITVNGDNPLTVECHGTFTDPGVTPSNSAATVTTSGTVDVNTPGNYTLTYTATDGTNTTTATRTVSVVDTVSPTIALNGAETVTVECHGTFTDPGATASDTCAGNLTSSIAVTGSVDVNVPGTYELIYSVADSADNAASVTRTVNVVDTTPPVITLTGANPLTVQCHTSFTDPGASAADGCAGNVAVTASGSVNANMPGTYTITYTASDPAGNAATPVTRTVNVVDTLPPVITLTGANPLTVECHTSFTDPGASALDACAGSVAVTASGSVNVNSPGTYTITYTASDPAGNAATPVTRTVTVVDHTPPTISCPANVVVTLPLNSTATSMAVSYPAVTATDTCSGATVTSTPASGSVFPVGTTTVTATATDTSGNTSTCQFTVTVLYNFAGFFSPVSNLPVFNTVNAGRAIPVKFSLSGNKGLNILASGYPASGTIACDSGVPTSEVTETVTAGNSSLSYDSAADQYVYVWSTNSAWAGTCRQLVIKLNDGSTHVANFKFR
ncbi:MAG TPA: immunoglobulin-like domain-containing protein [Blastocatellia bacterium]|nr:immunoglobulin-like domain-containing protein [Blastocatellia bacterium]